MNTKALFLVILKLIGLFGLYYVVGSIMSFIVYEVQYLFPDYYSDFTFYLMLTIARGLMFLIYMAVIYMLIFRTSWIVDKMLKEEEVQEVFTSFKIHQSTLLKIGIIVIGGVTLLNQLPLFVLQVWNFKLEFDFNEQGGRYYDPKIAFTSAVKILVSLFLLFYAQSVTNWVEQRRRRKAK